MNIHAVKQNLYVITVLFYRGIPSTLFECAPVSYYDPSLPASSYISEHLATYLPVGISHYHNMHPKTIFSSLQKHSPFLRNEYGYNGSYYMHNIVYSYVAN